MSGWKWLVSGVNGLPHRVPDDPAVIATYVGRGYELTDISGDMPAADDEDFAAALEEWQASKEPAEAEAAEPPDEVLEAPVEAESATTEKKVR